MECLAYLLGEISSTPTPTVPYFGNSWSKLGGSENFFRGSEFGFRAAEFLFHASPNFLESLISILARKLAIFYGKKRQKTPTLFKEGRKRENKKAKGTN